MLLKVGLCLVREVGGFDGWHSRIMNIWKGADSLQRYFTV